MMIQYMIPLINSYLNFVILSSMDKNSLDKLREASAAEAEAATAVWQAVQASSSPPAEVMPSDENVQATSSDGSDDDIDVRLHPRAVCNNLTVYPVFHFTRFRSLPWSVRIWFQFLQVVVAKETVGNLGGMVRQLSLDQFENESRRMVPVNSDTPYPNKRFTRQKSPQGLHKKVTTKSQNVISTSSCISNIC